MTPPDDFDPEIGVAVTLQDNLRRIVAPNPSPMTYRGTNTYLVGSRQLAVIDPGPASEAHLGAILGAIRPDQAVSHIIVTHSHLDHSPLAKPLSEATGAPICAFGDSFAGRSVAMTDLAQSGDIGGGEGIDPDFQPDTLLRDGETLRGDGWAFDILHTPGHLGNHICLGWGDACFTADHVMGWASSLVSPPDGDLTDFMTSCETLQSRSWRIFYPGHGAPVTAPRDRVDWLMSHRKAREAAILTTLQAGPATAHHLARQVYVETPPALLGAATRNVLAHLIDLKGKNQVEPVGAITPDVAFRLI